MRSISFIFVLMGLCILYSGCTATNTESSLESKAARMSPELLRSQVLRYKALVEKDAMEKALVKIYAEHSPRDTPYTPEVTAAINAALAEHAEMSGTKVSPSENLKNYRFFYKKLKEKGGDMTGLGLKHLYDYEQSLPPQKDYEKLLFPPIQETPAPHSESQITEPT